MYSTIVRNGRAVTIADWKKSPNTITWQDIRESFHRVAWHYSAKNALRSPDVPAVAEFRKIIEEAEKQQKSKP